MVLSTTGAVSENRRTVETYKSTYKWLIIPFVIAILGFIPSYYLKFFEVPFRHHLHGLSATLWYLFVIYQPYLISKNRVIDHKKTGIYGVFIAGLVVASAMLMIQGNIEGAERQIASGQVSPIAPPFFLYGISLFDFVAINGFALSVIMAIKKSKQIDEHAMWMIATVFWALMPALARLALAPLILTGNMTHLANVVMMTTPVILIVIVLLMVKLKRAHPALITVFIGNLTAFAVIPLGKSEAWIELVTAVFK